MEVRGIRWLGVGTEHVAEMRAFALDVLGLQVAGEDSDDFVELAMADGSKLELFGTPAAADGPWLFESNPVVAGFLVDDIQAARDELARTPSVELLGDLRVRTDGYAWQHFRAQTAGSMSSPLTLPLPERGVPRRDQRSTPSL